MSIGDTVFIFFLALIFFGPKKLPELARQLGKLVAEFKRASNEFRFQMEEELRMAEQADSQKRFAALQSAQPGDATPAIAAGTELSIMPPSTGLPVGAATEPDGVIAETPDVRDQWASTPSEQTGPGTEDPVQHQPSQLSALLGPPSQADAQADVQADAVSAPQATATYPGPYPDPFAHPHERLHSPSKPGDPDAQAAASNNHAAVPEPMEPSRAELTEEVQTTNG